MTLGNVKKSKPLTVDVNTTIFFSQQCDLLLENVLWMLF